MLLCIFQPTDFLPENLKQQQYSVVIDLGFRKKLEHLLYIFCRKKKLFDGDFAG